MRSNKHNKQSRYSNYKNKDFTDLVKPKHDKRSERRRINNDIRREVEKYYNGNNEDDYEDYKNSDFIF